MSSSCVQLGWLARDSGDPHPFQDPGGRCAPPHLAFMWRALNSGSHACVSPAQAEEGFIAVYRSSHPGDNSSKSCMSEEKISMLRSKQNGGDNQVIVWVSISIKKVSLMPTTCAKGHPRDGRQMLAVISFMWPSLWSYPSLRFHILPTEPSEGSGELM